MKLVGYVCVAALVWRGSVGVEIEVGKFSAVRLMWQGFNALLRKN